MEREQSWLTITKWGQYMRDGWEALAVNANIKISISGIPALSHLFISKR